MIEEIEVIRKPIIKPRKANPEFEHFGEDCKGTFNLELGVGRHCPECGRWYMGAD